MDKTRGFAALSGETIVSVDAKSINIVILTTASGKIFEIDAEYRHYGISIIALTDTTPK